MYDLAFHLRKKEGPQRESKGKKKKNERPEPRIERGTSRSLGWLPLRIIRITC